MSSLLIIIAGLLSQPFVLVSSQKVSSGACPEIRGISDFDISRYRGKWYEIAKIDHSKNGTCGVAHYEGESHWWALDAQHTELQNGAVTRSLGHLLINRITNGRLIIYLKDSTGSSFGSDYDILKTDYDGFSVVYGCRSPVPLVKHEFGWILSRSRSLNENQMGEIREALEENGISDTIYEKIKQEDCPNLE